MAAPSYGSINTTIKNAPEAPEAPESQDKPTCYQKIMSFFNCIFYLCCFLSGQYHMSSTGNDNDLVELTRHRYKWKKILSTIIAVIQAIMFAGFVAINIAHVTLNIIVEVCHRNITYCPRVFENEDEVNCTLPHQYWKISTAIIVSTFTELISYICMAIVLYLIYGHFCKFWCKPIVSSLCHCSASVKEALKQDKPFSPFGDPCTCHRNSSTAQTSEQAECFFLNYLICMLIYVGNIVAILYGNKVYQKYPCQINGINIASYVLFLICQFCSIQSVFIFSKIVYIITGKLNQLIKVMDKVNNKNLLAEINAEDPNEAPNDLISYLEIRDVDLKGLLQSANEHEVNKGYYYLLRNIDQKFINEVKPILKIFGCWFIIHWIFNALTTVLLSAVIIELVIDFFANNWKNAGKVIPTKNGVLEGEYILYLVMFVAGHTYLFVYPCFRAASITATREKLILGVSNKCWNHIPHPVETSFIQYLRTQNFSFKVPLCCAEFSFNFTMAFVSLFIGILGGFLNLHFF